MKLMLNMTAMSQRFLEHVVKILSIVLLVVRTFTMVIYSPKIEFFLLDQCVAKIFAATTIFKSRLV